MASSTDLETIRDYAVHFLTKHTQKSLAEPGIAYEFEVRFGQVVEKGGATSFRTDILALPYDAALVLARSVEWERVEEQDIDQYRLGARRIRINKQTGAVMENIVKKALGEHTIELQSLSHALRFSLASERPQEGLPEDLTGWEKSHKLRTRFSAGSVSVDFTKTKAHYGKERQIEIEARLPGNPTEEDISTMVGGLVMLLATFDTALS